MTSHPDSTLIGTTAAAATVLVTGASGFIGRRLCEYLVGQGYVVRASVRNARTPPGAADVTVQEINSRTSWERALQGVDYVVHLAALAHQIGARVPSTAYEEVNHRGTARLAEAIASSGTVRRLVFVSSIGAVCSQSRTAVTEKTPCQPDTDYGRSKRAAELAISTILAKSPADWCILRPTLVYGPGNPGNMLRLMRLARSRFPLPLASITNRRTFLFVGNLVEVIEKALTHPNASRKTFNVADSEVLSTPELIRQLGALCGSRARLSPAPLWSLRLLGSFGDIISRLTRRSLGIDSYSVERLLSSLEVDNSYARAQLGWTPACTTHEALGLTMADQNRPAAAPFEERSEAAQA